MVSSGVSNKNSRRVNVSFVQDTPAGVGVLEIRLLICKMVVILVIFYLASDPAVDIQQG
jgi:hypothetical protein